MINGNSYIQENLRKLRVKSESGVLWDKIFFLVLSAAILAAILFSKGWFHH